MKNKIIKKTFYKKWKNRYDEIQKRNKLFYRILIKKKNRILVIELN